MNYTHQQNKSVISEQADLLATQANSASYPQQQRELRVEGPVRVNGHWTVVLLHASVGYPQAVFARWMHEMLQTGMYKHSVVLLS